MTAPTPAPAPPPRQRLLRSRDGFQRPSGEGVEGATGWDLVGRGRLEISGLEEGARSGLNGFVG
jgi:hypothetical protein